MAMKATSSSQDEKTCRYPSDDPIGESVYLVFTKTKKPKSKISSRPWQNRKTKTNVFKNYYLWAGFHLHTLAMLASLFDEEFSIVDDDTDKTLVTQDVATLRVRVSQSKIGEFAQGKGTRVLRRLRWDCDSWTRCKTLADDYGNPIRVWRRVRKRPVCRPSIRQKCDTPPPRRR